MKLNNFTPEIMKNCLKMNMGVELETLRVTAAGEMAKTPPPFREGDTLTRDFAENQMEINTPIYHSEKDARAYLNNTLIEMRRTLAKKKEPEYLWPSSVPPVLHSENDVPIAQYSGWDAPETTYREYLAAKYDRHRMALCGVHVNFSISDDLLLWVHSQNFKNDTNYSNWKNQLYLEIAQKALAYGWILTALTAASPLVDGSYFDYTAAGTTGYCGMASVRQSEFGFWNNFSPVLDYSTLNNYADSLEDLMVKKLLHCPSELYIPVRIKPAGQYSIERLHRAADHIELRMIDVNPMEPSGVELWVLEFCRFFLLWCAFGSDTLTLRNEQQVQCYQNFKNAARYDLNSATVTLPDGMVKTVQEAAVDVLASMREFYNRVLDKVGQFAPALQAAGVDGLFHCLTVAEDKINTPDRRYSHIIKEHCGSDFAAITLGLTKSYSNIAADIRNKNKAV